MMIFSRQRKNLPRLSSGKVCRSFWTFILSG